MERLPVHLPLQKNVVFARGCEAQAAAGALSKNSKLEAWFRLNSSADSLSADTAALVRSLRYPDIPRYFIWEGKTCSWKPRTKALKEYIFDVNFLGKLKLSPALR